MVFQMHDYLNSLKYCTYSIIQTQTNLTSIQQKFLIHVSTKTKVEKENRQKRESETALENEIITKPVTQ